MGIVANIPVAKRAALHDLHLSFIGCGVMAEAMIGGLLSQKVVQPPQIVGSHPRPARREELAARYGIQMFEKNTDAATFDLEQKF